MIRAKSAAGILLSFHLIGSAWANTGIVVSPAGHVLTAYHVVRSCTAVKVAGGIPAVQVAVDRLHDLALFKMAKPSKDVALFRATPGFGIGYGVTVAGFPLKDWASPFPKITTGIVTSVGELDPSGRRNDHRRFVRFTARLVSGISGGPVLDNAGNLVGLAVAVVRLPGEIDGERYSMKQGLGVPRKRLIAFLDAHKVPYRKALRDDALSEEAIEEKARGFTVRVRCSK